MRRSNQLNPMRSMILLAVTWVAGTLLFAAERAPTPATASPTVALTQTPAEPGEEGATPTPPESPPSPSGEADNSKASAEADERVDEPDESVASEPANADEESKASSDATPRATAADTQGAKSSPQRFVPSEQVRADFDVSFPIDI
jgi:hypothetical protein